MNVEITALAFFAIEKLLAEKIYNSFTDDQKEKINYNKKNYRLWHQNKPGVDGINVFDQTFGFDVVARNYFYKRSGVLRRAKASFTSMRDSILVDALNSLGVNPPNGLQRIDYVDDGVLAEALYDEFKKDERYLKEVEKNKPSDDSEDHSNIQSDKRSPSTIQLTNGSNKNNEYQNEEGTIIELLSMYFQLIQEKKLFKLSEFWLPSVRASFKLNLFVPIVTLNDINIGKVVIEHGQSGRKLATCYVSYIEMSNFHTNDRLQSLTKNSRLENIDEFVEKIEIIKKLLKVYDFPNVDSISIKELFKSKIHEQLEAMLEYDDLASFPQLKPCKIGRLLLVMLTLADDNKWYILRTKSINTNEIEWIL